MNIDYKLYAITDRSYLKNISLYDAVFEAIAGGASVIQLREKNITDEEFLKLALEIKPLCNKYHVPLIINDNLDVMLKSDADGIHIGQDDLDASYVRSVIGPDKILGVSAHNISEALKAQKDGANYIGVGAMFKTDTKKNACVVGIDTLKEIKKNVDISVVAIGGINKDNLSYFKDSFIDGFCFVSAIFNSNDIRESTKDLYKKITLLKKEKYAPRVLVIAGSDSSGGAGIQADIKTITSHMAYGETAICALTSQNTLGVYDILNVSEDFLASEIDACITDIYPDAVKIGMVSDKNLIKIIKEKIKEHRLKNIVLDPVMISTSGSRLLKIDAIDTLISELFPLSDVITPNILEASYLSNIDIKNENDMIKAALKLKEELNLASILVKGGHSVNDANDLLLTNNELKWFKGSRILNNNTHGTGCTLSSAIASNLAWGNTLEESIKKAKDYISKALKSNFNIGHSSGPIYHMCNLEIKDE